MSDDPVIVDMDLSGLKALQALGPEAVEKAMRELAFLTEQKMKLNIQAMNAIETGALLNSVYTVTKVDSGFSAASGAARSRNPDVEIVKLPDPSGDVVAIVGPCVEYGKWVELGSEKRHRAARPFLFNATEQVKALIPEYVKRKLAEVIR